MKRWWFKTYTIPWFAMGLLICPLTVEAVFPDIQTETPTRTPTATPSPTPTWYSDVIRVPQDFVFIQQAINRAVDGFTILVSQGTYRETINFTGKAILVESTSGPEVTEIDGQYSGTVVTFATNETYDSILRGFRIRRGSGSGSPNFTGGGVTCMNSSPTLEDNIFTQNQGIRGAAVYCFNSSPLIVNNFFQSNSASQDGGAIACVLTSTPQVYNNLLLDNSASYGGAIFCQLSAPLVVNNTFHDNTGTQAGSGVYAFDNSAPQILNNIIVNSSNGEGIYATLNSTPLIAYNDVWNNSDGDYGGDAVPGTGDISDNPLFIIATQDRTLPRFYLSQIASGQPDNSPCLNSGNDLASNICFPYHETESCISDWTTRTDQEPDQFQVDLGCHYRPGSSPVPTATPTVTRTPTETGIPTEPPSPSPTHAPRTIRVPQDYIHIQEAIAAAFSGDTILVSGGVYYENLSLLGKQLILMAEAGPGSTIIDGGHQGSTITISSGEPAGTIINGFWIRRGRGTSSGDTTTGGGLSIKNQAAPLITNCTVSLNDGAFGGGLLIENASPTVQDCTITSNQVQYDGGGIYVRDCTDVTIVNNLIYSNSSRHGAGVFLAEATVLVNNNTIAYNAANQLGGGIYCFNASDSIIKDNIIVLSTDGEGVYSFSDTQLILNYCTIFGNADGHFAGNVAEGVGCLHADPLFIAAYSNSFYLSNPGAGQSALSPCVNTGSGTAADLGLTTYTTRTDQVTDSGIVDMGFHYFPITPPTNTPEPSPTPTPENTATPIYGLTIDTNQQFYTVGDHFLLMVETLNTGATTLVDLYIALDVYGSYWWWPSWSTDLNFWPDRPFQSDLHSYVILEFDWPAGGGAASGIFFWAAALYPDTVDLLCDVANCEFGFY